MPYSRTWKSWDNLAWGNRRLSRDDNSCDQLPRVIIKIVDQKLQSFNFSKSGMGFSGSSETFVTFNMMILSFKNHTLVLALRCWWILFAYLTGTLCSGNSYNTHVKSHSHVINHFTKYKQILIHIQLKKTFFPHFITMHNKVRKSLQYILFWNRRQSNPTCSCGLCYKLVDLFFYLCSKIASKALSLVLY